MPIVQIPADRMIRAQLPAGVEDGRRLSFDGPVKLETYGRAMIELAPGILVGSVELGEGVWQVQGHHQESAPAEARWVVRRA